ncbi:hypothetical protein AK830_g5947 [Neonectria ditissima]|uniref:J domain-containing protein n=1 Tax=Neonectria ditissima TaxID=78410 RepID=A0A0P7BKQ3_9HYPO|nr:hypothetical protein AK830_g5947 [Neonectria ditissima]
MADSSGTRRGSLRVPRVRPSAGASRASSVRSSGAFDDVRLPVPAAASSAAHNLRVASSRFSLNDQFAATRQEYELWDDDASSIFERVTNASEAGDPDRTLASSGGSGPAPGPELDCYYDILCLPRDAANLPQDRIRRAYHRLFLLFYPDSYPEHLRPIARQQFLRAQEAFEALIDPARRAQYDLTRFLQADDETASSNHEAAFKEAVRHRLQNGLHTSSDLGVRLDATRTGSRRGSSSWQGGSSRLRLLDFALSQSVSVDVPALRGLLQPQVSRLERLAATNEKKREEVEGLSQPSIEVATPTLTVSGSVYGVTGDLFIPTALLYDRYQPLLPSTIPRHRLIQLVENKLSPLVALRYRQEILNRAPASSPDKVQWIKTAVEAETDILPEFSVTSRLYHHIILPNVTEPTVLEASVQSSRHVPRTPPRLVLGARQSIYRGTAFARADSGDWVLGASESGRFFADFSKMNPNMFSADSTMKTTPSFELGFRTGPSQRISVPGSPEAPSSVRGIRGLDSEVDTCREGTWAISAAATPTSVGGFVRYSKNLSLPSALLSPAEPAAPPPARVEVELCSNSFQDRYLALRNLWSVGRFARLGLEVGVSLHSLHLSVYWSRLGQRISVPLLIAPQALFSRDIFFWAAALPFAGLAAVQLAVHRRRGRGSKTGSLTRRSARPEAPESAAHVTVARSRYEADNVTVLLAQPVEARQKRQIALGGLVIMSAKYGVPNSNGDLAGEHVADVTIALAALIDDSSSNAGASLVIPGSVRKSRIPGFWDPAPDREKTLRVQYNFKGVETVADFRVGEEVILPLSPPIKS